VIEYFLSPNNVKTKKNKIKAIKNPSIKSDVWGFLELKA
jgi:hypothetical protein